MTSVTLDSVLRWFYAISEVPRTSGNEEAIAAMLSSFARTRGYEVIKDSSHNLLIRKPGRPGRPPLALQAHLDMVGEKDPGSTHNFERDPIQIVRDGDFLSASGTALGADDGIGCALAMTIMESDDLDHPDLEFLFTTGEETGLTGAKALAVGDLRARYLLNLDGEQDGVFLTSCAGGTTIDLAFDLGTLEPSAPAYEVYLSGLSGGHSGLDIDKGRVNGIVAVADLLGRVAELGPVRIGGIDAPGKFNAINREVRVVFSTEALGVGDLCGRWADEVRAADGGAEVSFRELAAGVACATVGTSARLLELLRALPNGVHSLSNNLPGLVESSLNVGLVTMAGAQLTVTASTRSSDKAKHEAMLQELRVLAGNASAEVRFYGQYPAWEFDPDNPLLHQAEQIYTELFGRAPSVTGVHGGLECAVLADTFPGLPMLSVGADLFDCHTPRERASISSIERMTSLVRGIVERIT